MEACQKSPIVPAMKSSTSLGARETIGHDVLDHRLQIG
jgi:hypothetical protein